MTANGTEHETKIEQVAKAIWEANAPPGAPDWEGLNGSEQYQVELIAIECIRAMKVPTDAMLKAVSSIEDIEHIDRDPEYYWSRMIDAALEEV